MALIGQALSEKKIFENGGRRTDDDGRTPDHGHPISSPCEPNGSGELTKAQISCQVIAQLISVFVFATGKVQFLVFLNPKFQASSLLL